MPVFPATARKVAEFDPRLKTGLAFAAGILVWNAGLPGVLIYLAGALFLLLALRFRLPSLAGAGRAYAVFVFVWVGVKAGGDLLSGLPLEAALAGAGMLGLRLAVLVLLGLALAASASARQLGLAVAWAASPLLRGRAWQAGLALGLCVHYLPLVWQVVKDTRKCAGLRLAGRSAPARLGAALKASVRILGSRVHAQALAVALRNMDDPGAWRGISPVARSQMVSALALALALAGAARL